MHSKIVILLLLLSCSSFQTIAQSLEAKLTHAADSVFKANPKAVGVLLDVRSEKFNIQFTYAVGYHDKDKTNKLSTQHPILIASNTKTYVAAAILKLIDLGKLGLSRTIEGYLNTKTVQHLQKAGYDLKSITVEQLLSHTSGIRDYVDDTYFTFVDEHPQHLWTRDQQIELAINKGGPIAEPGATFTYADVNYLLLTEVIETITNQSYYQAMHDILEFEGLGITDTWFEGLEPRPEGTLVLAHQYWDKKGWDSELINPSWDLYGGGGLAATVKDVGLFYYKLFTGQIVQNRKLLQEMTSYVLPVDQSKYCLGIRNIKFHGMTGFYHGGFWGTDAMYLPEYDLAITVFTLSKDQRSINAALSWNLIQLIKNHN